MDSWKLVLCTQKIKRQLVEKQTVLWKNRKRTGSITECKALPTRIRPAPIHPLYGLGLVGV